MTATVSTTSPRETRGRRMEMILLLLGALAFAAAPAKDQIGILLREPVWPIAAALTATAFAITAGVVVRRMTRSST